MPSLVSRFFPAFTVRNANAVTFLMQTVSVCRIARSEGVIKYVVVKRANLFRLPSDMSIEDGAFIEPDTGLTRLSSGAGAAGKT